MNVSLKFVTEDGTTRHALTCPAIDFDGKPIASLEILGVNLCGIRLDWPAIPLTITPGQKIVVEFDMPKRPSRTVEELLAILKSPIYF